MKPDYRKAMIESEIVKLVMEAIRQAKDPKIAGKLITVSRAELSKDKRYVDVYISVVGDENERKNLVEHMNKIKGYFRSYIAQNLDIYAVPDIRFKEDKGIEASVRVHSLLEKLKEDKKGERNSAG
ncbi:30S ribosome-binding factor RbfA [Pseudothermotoga thermarum]|uniref:Ribosome-binding factor A n=1 Tax=Pseudothermotoga thermarum DSM 5069 TaxID=688269 RepID=F7YYL7_9THEM|nr:30S ribosome-binding factor RbfA [Pseudothermotoga thermarum]AEH51049.1 ribosome-binding factor A [Pseudothermotoga thermarum DSM 5069]